MEPMCRQPKYLQNLCKGLYSQGKSVGKVSFSLRLRKVSETCIGGGKIALLYCKLRKKYHFIITEVFDLFIQHLKFLAVQV